MTPGGHVVVVGGGLAGLSAAIHCADAGARVTLMERRRRLGGLTSSFRHGDLVMDNGQHVFMACCREYRRFLDRIGSQSDVAGPAPLDLPVAAAGSGGPRMARVRRIPGLPAPFHLAPSLLAYPHLGLAARLGLGRALIALMRLDLGDPALDQITFGDWLRARGQSHEAVTAVWDLITVPTVNLPAAEASLAAAAMVFRTGLLAEPDAADIGWSRVPLGTLHGDRAAEVLRRGGATLHTEVRVQGVRGGGDDRWEVLTPDGPVGADAVVLAVPHEEAARLAPEGVWPAQERWRDLGSSAVVDVHLRFDRPVTRYEMMGAVRSPVQWVFDRTRAAGLDPADGQYLAVSLSAADALLDRRPEEITASVLQALSELLPPTRAATVTDSIVTKERHATFRAAPGVAALRPGPLGRLPGIALAGAWTDTGWPATMEGAVRSGRAAAEAVLGGAAEASTVRTNSQVRQEVA